MSHESVQAVKIRTRADIFENPNSNPHSHAFSSPQPSLCSFQSPPYMSSIYYLLIPIHSSPLPAPAAGLGSSWPEPSIIPRQDCIKDSSLQINLKGKTMTPGIAAELWRPPIKLFAFDHILSFLPSRWMWTHEHMDTCRRLHPHNQTKCCHILYIPSLLVLATSFLSYKHNFALLCSLYSIFTLYSPFSATFALALSLTSTQRYTQKHTWKKKNIQTKAYLREDDDGTITWKQSCLPFSCVPSDCLAL